MSAVRIATTIAQGLLLAVVGLVLLIAGGVVVIAATVGVCAAAVALLWGVADLLVYFIGMSFRWSFVSALALALVGVLAGVDSRRADHSQSRVAHDIANPEAVAALGAQVRQVVTGERM